MNASTALTGELVEVPEAAQAAQLANGALEVAKAYTIDSAAMYALAGDELRDIATKKARLNETRMSLTRPLDQAKQRIMDLFRGPLEVLDQADKVLRGSMLVWKQADDERIRREREEAQRREREEAQRLERIRQKAEEAERQARAEADKAMKDGDDAAFTAAAQAAEEAAAVREEAEEAKAVAEVAPLPTVPAAAKAQGVAARVTWKAEVTSLAELVKGAAKALEAGDETLLAFLLPNTTALNQAAKAMKGAARIPGVRVYGDESLSVRRK